MDFLIFTESHTHLKWLNNGIHLNSNLRLLYLCIFITGKQAGTEQALRS